MDLEALKAEAMRSAKKRARIILVPGFDMVICLHRDSYVRMHRHPRYEAYHVIQGDLIVETARGAALHTEESPIVTIPPLTWHEPSAASDFVIYREFYCGPFDKERDVDYAPWTEQEAA